MSRILIAVADTELRKQICEFLNDEKELENTVVEEFSDYACITTALSKHDDVALVVIDYDLGYETDKSTGKPLNQSVLLAQNLAKGETGPGLLILGPVTISTDWQKIALLRQAKIIEIGDMYRPSPDHTRPFFVSMILNMIEYFPAHIEQDEVPRGLIELTIDDNDFVHCRTALIYKDGHPRHRFSKDFPYDSKIKKIMKALTLSLSNMEIDREEFLVNYRLIGEKTRDILNYDEATMRAAMELILRAKGVDNVWVRFRVPYRNMPPIPFEAILQCDLYDEEKTTSDFQLAHSPVYRVVGDPRSPGSQLQLPMLSALHENTPENISCLIIDASTSGLVDRGFDKDLPETLDEISEYGAKEIETVLTLFSNMKKVGAVTEICVEDFKTDEAKNDPIAVLDEIFKSRNWDIIHFCGHSFYKTGEDSTRDKAYIFLPGDGMAIPVSIKKVANWFSGANLVYMSSCQSAEPAFVNALAERDIPTIIGFRWNVTSIGATQFAGLFYHNLFHDRMGDVEPAFVEAQRTLMDPANYQLPRIFRKNRIWKQPDARAWASPMLVMQNV